MTVITYSWSWKVLMENNLSALNDEERNLLHLRQQLQKIKRVREEQAKKGCVVHEIMKSAYKPLYV